LDALFGLAVGVNEGFFNEGLELRLAERLPGGPPNLLYLTTC
jgi:hypothetical protein